MMKNLKKVISAVAALALSVSSFAAFAQDFPDVASTAKYAKAVDQLTSLGVVTGYEDGTFGPDKLVTRAEMTAMIVRALGSEAQAQSAANQNTRFADVTANHWAAGYVTVGVNATPMFIQGMGDGTFAPDANVTFAQATTMLVRATGYESRACLTAWPTGYLSYGSQLGITTGVSGEVGNDTEVNRGQVAQLIDNAIVDAPLLVEDKLTQDVWGNPVWEYKQMNGRGEGYDTLLINKHDAYKVYGTVTATRKQNDGLDANEVKFSIQRAENFEDDYINNTANYPAKEITAYVGTTKAADNLNVYAEAIIKVDDNDEYTLVSFIPSGRTDSVTYKTEDYAASKSDVTSANKAMYFYTDENQSRTTSAKLSGAAQGGEVEWYINGVRVNGQPDITKYVENNKTGEITLIDSKSANSASSTDGYYDSVMITYYADAVFKSVSNSVTSPRLYFDKASNELRSYITVDTDSDTTYDFRLGSPDEYETIELEDLQANDVLSIAWDVVNGDVNASKFVTVYVSRDTVDGTVMGSSDEKGYQIGDAYYEPNESTVKFAANQIENGTDYTFYLNVFGKIANVEEGVSTKLLGVLDRAWETDGGIYKVRMITNAGEKVEYEFTTQKADKLKEAVRMMTNGNVADDPENADKRGTDDYTQVTDSNKDAPQFRVVEYTVSASKGTISLKKEVAPVAGTATGDDTPTDKVDQLYRASSNRLGNIRLGDNTVAVDLIDYLSDDTVGLMSGFTDDEKYEAYGYNKSNNDNTCSFVIVIDGASDYTTESPLTILASTSNVTTEEGENTLQLQVYSKGDVQYLRVDPEQYSTDWLSENHLAVGSAFLYKADSKGYVTEIKNILNLDDSYTDFTAKVFGKANFNDMVEAYAKEGENAGILRKGSNTTGYFAFGPVMETVGGIALGKLAVADGKKTTNMSALDDYSFDTSTNVYVYDYGMNKKSQRVDASIESAFVETFLDEKAKPSSSDIVNWDADPAESDIMKNVNYALLKVVDNEVTEGYAIIPPIND